MTVLRASRLLVRGHIHGQGEDVPSIDMFPFASPLEI